MLAISFAPANTYACKKHDSKHKLTNCCLTKKGSNEKCGHKATADKGKTACNHAGCKCTASQIVNLVFPSEGWSVKAPEFPIKNNYFSYNQNNIRKGYYSIWLPPNIG